MKPVHEWVARTLATIGILAMNPAHAELGDDVVAKLNRLYNDTRPSCGHDPAYACSGIVMRALNPHLEFGPWSISPNARNSGGLSASYLRKDVKFRTLAWDLQSGIILDSIADNPPAHADYTVLCSFPIDAGSDNRKQNGCADSVSTSDHIEKLCHEQKVTTAEQWMADYKKQGRSNSKQCGFDVSPARKALAAPAFYESLRAEHLLARETYGTSNELRLQLWDEKPPLSPSILAAFRISDSGLYGARLYQLQYWYHTHQLLPVVSIQMPQTLNDDAKFSYRPSDQVIYPTTEKNGCPAYIQSATWIERYDLGFRKNLWALSVVPTPCGRATGPGQTNNFFNELVTFYWNHEQWKGNKDNPDNNIASMRRQLVCHFQIARTKPEWNLEPSRPYVSNEESVKQGCNNVN